MVCCLLHSGVAMGGEGEHVATQRWAGTCPPYLGHGGWVMGFTEILSFFFWGGGVGTGCASRLCNEPVLLNQYSILLGKCCRLSEISGFRGLRLSPTWTPLGDLRPPDLLSRPAPTLPPNSRYATAFAENLYIIFEKFSSNAIRLKPP